MRKETSVSPTNDRQEILALITAINAAWLEGRVEELREYFHDDIVFVPPGFEGRIEGKEKCVGSYHDFMSQAIVKDFKTAEPKVDVWGDTGVVSYPWEMAWEMGGQSYRESGHDLLVLARGAEGWRAVWRTALSSPNAG